jgi:predicted metalloprotease with PDZ domain
LLAPDRDNLSLLDVSQRRWTSTSSLVYDRGMLVAFLYDLQLRSLSDGKKSAADVYARLFQESQGMSPSTANDVIIGLLDSPDGMGQFSARNIKSNAPIDLEVLLAPYGIEVRRENFKTQLTVSKNLSNEQRRLLKSLGYKN